MLKSLISMASGKSSTNSAKTIQTPNSSSNHLYFHIWLLLMSLTIFAFYVGYDLKFFQSMLELDQSYLSILILIIFTFASMHAAWNIIAVSQRIELAQSILENKMKIARLDTDGTETSSFSLVAGSPLGFFEGFVSNLKLARQKKMKQPKDDSASLNNDSNEHIMEIYADQLRSPGEIGWYIVDILVRLGLIGTIIGFILILRSLIEGPLPDATEIQKLLIKMSGGMGTALYTTLSGLVTATLLGIQYMILGRGVEQLISCMLRIKDHIES